MKYRTKKITRTVPHTVGADTRYVEVTDTVEVPVLPRDWDRIVLLGLSAVAVLGIVISVAWSTASIGGLLSLTVPDAIAYAAASIFDLAWITCLAAEWLDRYNTAKAVMPRRIGHVALLIAMLAVFARGAMSGSWVTGLVGAVVSGIAKVIWMVVLHHQSKPLDDRTQQWVNQYNAEAGAQLAMVTVNRQLARAREGYEGTHVPIITTAEDNAGQARAAVRAAVHTMPDATPEEIVEQLARVGITVTADTVRTETGQAADSPDSRPEATISDTVRVLVGLGVNDPDAALPAVRAAHGEHVTRDTVARTLRRAAQEAKA